MIIYDLATNNVEQTLEAAALFVNNVLIKSCKPTANIVYLIGDLGAGKTTFMRGMLASLGFNGVVKSPTYTIVETYPDLIIPIYHFDLYRLADPHELELIGIRDYLQDQSICCFEWPTKGIGYIPSPDFVIQLEIISDNPDNKRQIKISDTKVC